MGTYKIETIVSAQITLEGLKAEELSKIEGFLRDLVGVKPEVAETKETDAEDPLFEPNRAMRERNTAADKLLEELPIPNKWKHLPRYSGYEKIADVFKDAELHPDDYYWEMRIAKAWMNEIPNLRGVRLHTVAHTLGAMANLGLCAREERYNPAIQKNEVLFGVPIPKALGVSSVSPEAASFGKKICAARRDSTLSLKEFSELIGYDSNIIMGWENGSLTPSTEAMKTLRGLFGDDYFEEDR